MDFFLINRHVATLSPHFMTTEKMSYRHSLAATLHHLAKL